MRFNVRLFLAIALLFTSSLIAHAYTIISVTFDGDAENPTITIHGSGFGAPPVSTATALSGYTGLDYGTALHITDSSTNPLFDAGYDNPGTGSHDTIGLINLSYSDTLISYGLGSTYASYPLKFNNGDTYSVHVDGASFSGKVALPPNRIRYFCLVRAS